MNKGRKGLLIASSIITLVACFFGIIGAGIMMFFGNMFSESFVKDIYLEDPAYQYVEVPDGSYYFEPISGNEEEIVTDEAIQLASTVVSGLLMATAVVTVGFSVAKLILAIKVLAASTKNKYRKGCVIALTVLSCLDLKILESVLLIVAMTLKDKKANTADPIEQTV